MGETSRGRNIQVGLGSEKRAEGSSCSAQSRTFEFYFRCNKKLLEGFKSRITRSVLCTEKIGLVAVWRTDLEREQGGLLGG